MTSQALERLVPTTRVQFAKRRGALRRWQFFRTSVRDIISRQCRDLVLGLGHSSDFVVVEVESLSRDSRRVSDLKLGPSWPGTHSSHCGVGKDLWYHDEGTENGRPPRSLACRRSLNADKSMGCAVGTLGDSP